MYISKIEIKNFQCHEYLHLDLQPGVNAIIGESDKGKSAIIRAIRWLFFNKPDGQQYRKHGTSQTMVSATMNDGTIVTRTRSITVNRYSIEGPNRKAEVYDNFGRDVPAPIVQTLGIWPAEIAPNLTSELSIASQFEGPFLLGESGIVKAQVLGKISKTTVLDDAVRIVSSEVRSNGKFLNMTLEAIEQAENDLVSFLNLDSEAESVKIIERGLGDLNLMKQKIEAGARIEKSLIENDNRMLLISKKLAGFAKIPKIDELEIIASGLAKGWGMSNRLTEIDKDLPRLTEKFKRVSRISDEEIQNLGAQAEKVKEALALAVRVEDWKSRHLSTKANLDTLREKVHVRTNDLLIIIRREGKCPLCFHNIDDESFDRIEKEIRGEDQ